MLYRVSYFPPSIEPVKESNLEFPPKGTAPTDAKPSNRGVITLYYWLVIFMYLSF
jgi:hypothetical protein